MYLSRFAFHTLPGRTGEVEEQLRKLRELVAAAGASQPRILHTHFASLGAPDVIFEQEASSLGELENQIAKLTENADFQLWTKNMSGLLKESPKREIYLIAEE
ncbi:MAG TPA: hypothetical protein VE131_09620 [Terriglobales bacterium]|nr:hypothetical protein [Terriglobales bacterium]